MALLSPDSEALVEAAEREDNVANLALGAVSPEVVRLARTMYHILVSTVTGKALMVVRKAERSNGLAAWKLLCEEYEPRSSSRLTAVLCGLLSPSWTRLDNTAFLRALAAWTSR